MPANAPPVNPLVAAYGLLLLMSIFGAWVWAIVQLALGRSILPRFAPRVVPWGAASVALATLGYLAIQVAVQVGYLLAVHGLGRHERQAAARAGFGAADMMITSAIWNGAVILLIPLLLAATSGARGRDFGLGDPARSRRRVLQGMLAWPLMAPPVYGALFLAVRIWGKGTHPLETAITDEGFGRGAPVLFLASVALAPMAEELIFRGVLLGWLTRLVLRGGAARADVAEQAAGAAAPIAPPEAADALDTPAHENLPVRATDEFAPPTTDLAPPVAPGGAVDPDAAAILPRWPAVAGRLLAANVLVSILFGGLHATVWPAPVPIFLLSLVLGLLYQRTGSLVAPMALHMTFNAVSTIMMFLTLTGSTPPGPVAPAAPREAPVPTPVTDPIPVPIPAPGA